MRVVVCSYHSYSVRTMAGFFFGAPVGNHFVGSVVPFDCRRPCSCWFGCGRVLVLGSCSWGSRWRGDFWKGFVDVGLCWKSMSRGSSLWAIVAFIVVSMPV